MSQKGRSHSVKPCPHCGGKLLWDTYEEEDYCLNCARGRTPQVVAEKPRSRLQRLQAKDKPQTVAAPTPIQKREKTMADAPHAKTQTYDRKIPAPARVDVRRRPGFRYYPLLNLYTNGAWYSPGQIKFRREHMKFLIKSLPMLQEGKYPPNPIGTGYYNFKISRKGGRQLAYFESPTILAAEVEQRLALCGRDGIILEAILCWGKKPEYLMSAFELNERQLERRIDEALRYISGWERREKSYKEFRTHRKTTQTSGADTSKQKECQALSVG